MSINKFGDEVKGSLRLVHRHKMTSLINNSELKIASFLIVSNGL